jgi:hypothetical protein
MKIVLKKLEGITKKNNEMESDNEKDIKDYKKN